MGLFKPGWMSDNPKRRAKALDRLGVRELADIARNTELASERRMEAIDRLPEEQLLALLYGLDASKDYGIAVQIISTLECQESLAVMALDQSLDDGLRHNAMERVNDEDVLAAYARDESAWNRSDAIRCMHTGKLIAQVGLEIGTRHTAAAWAAAQRLQELGDDENLGWLILRTDTWSTFDARKFIERYASDAAFIRQLYYEARSDALRIYALWELKRQGIASRDMLAEARPLARRLMAQQGDVLLIRRLLESAGPLGSLEPDERAYFYDLLRKDPNDSFALSQLLACGDPAGLAFMPFHEKLWFRPSYLSDEEVARVLDVDEDFALDYLKVFMERGCSNTFGGPSHAITNCARTIRLMHANGRARERIEQELPSHEHRSISYTYQDNEGDLRDTCDEFDVVYWQ